MRSGRAFSGALAVAKKELNPFVLRRTQTVASNSPEIAVIMRIERRNDDHAKGLYKLA
jgi:hypothetical protein